MMFRWNNFALFAALFCGVVYESYCEAQVDCLQYSIYDDGTNFLFVADEYRTNTVCDTFVGEFYFWVTGTLPTCPEACSGPCSPRFTDPKLQPAGSKSHLIRSDDSFHGPLPRADFVLGKKLNGDQLTAVPGLPRPTDGITTISPTNGKGNDIIWVQTNGAPIPVKLFKVVLNFQRAGGAGLPRVIFIGFELNPEGAGAVTNAVKVRVNDGAKHSGKYDVIDAGGDTHTYHIVTKTDLLQ